MNEKIVIFDLDGTIYTANKLAYALTNEFQQQINFEDIRYYDVNLSMIELGILEKDNNFDWKSFWRKNEDLLFMEQPLQNGFLEFRNFLKEEGIPFEYITARKNNLRNVTKQSFEMHGIAEDYKKIHFGYQPEKKLNHAKRIRNKKGKNSEIIIFEDNADTLLHFATNGFRSIGIEQPYNKHLKAEEHPLLSITKNFVGITEKI